MIDKKIMDKKMMEEIHMNQWQPLQTMLYDGWVLRFSKGYSRRANSINPLYHSSGDLEEKIKQCEALYERHQLSTIFKITPLSQPSELDDVLEQRGYIADEIVSIQVASLDNIAEPSLQTVQVNGQVEDEWIALFCRMSGVEERHQETKKRMLGHELSEQGYFVVYDGGVPVAVGLGMIERGVLGVFDVVTDAQFRGKGYAKQLLLHMMNWGKARGATHSYLAVVPDNVAAVRLYGKLGYEEVYRYWYRVQATS